MLIKKLILNNFRQFTNEQVIEFSTDSTKKATLVIAENGTGKTTIIESFSWIFYGKTKISSILNTEIKNKLTSGEKTKVSGTIILEHMNREYTITRFQEFTKSNSSNSVLRIDYKNDEGSLKQLRGIDAEKEINEIVPEELFSYFFFKGENIEKIGKEINTAKNIKNNEFVKAIRGMLGFTWLYQTREDLKTISKEYNEELATNTIEGKLADLARRKNNIEQEITRNNNNIEEYKREIPQYEEKIEQLNQSIIQFGDIGEKQKESRNLEQEITKTKNNIKEIKKNLLSNFSKNAYSVFSDKLIKNAISLIDDNADIDKGIPGLEVSAIDYLLEQKKCLCGAELIEGSEEYKKLEDLKKYLPPNNLGYEMANFKSYADSTKSLSESCYNAFLEQRKNFHQKISSYNNLVEKYNKLTEQIKNFADVSALKNQEIECKIKLNSLNNQLGKAEGFLENANNELEKLAKERENYSVTDSRLKKIDLCRKYVEDLIEQINIYCENKEKEKRQQLEDAINMIYKEIFNLNISIKLDENYNITRNADGMSDLSEHETSTSQDAIMAFSFIGGIIRLAREKVLSNDDFENNDDTEPYPLVMDAPSSSFDIERIKNFCHLMPQIAEQVIFFIKDTDGLYVKEYLEDSIGKEYKFKKVNDYNTIIEEV